MANLCSHFDDGLQAEWHFFLTSHGKSPCDGLGGTVKRLVARASLQATVDNHILTPHDVYIWAQQHIDNIDFFFVSQDQIEENTLKFKLAECVQLSKTIVGVRSHHSFIPCVDGKLEMRRVSLDEAYSTIDMHKGTDVQDWGQFQPGKYVACIYDGNWYVGNIKDRSDAIVTFLFHSQNDLKKTF